MASQHPLDWFPDPVTDRERSAWAEGDPIDSLVLIDKARSALAQARSLTDIGAVREIAERARRYASAAKLGRAAENHAARLRLEAERKAGALLSEAPKQKPGQYQQRSPDGTVAVPPALADLGVTKKQSSDWQRMAKVPEPIFEKHVQQAERKGEALTTAGVVKVARDIERKRRADEPKPIVEPATIRARIDVADARNLPLEDETVDLIVTSPPYALGLGYDGGDIEPDDWFELIRHAVREAWRVAKPSGRLALNVPLDTSIPTPRPLYAEAVAAAFDSGWVYRFTILWNEGNTTKGNRSLGSVDSAARPHHVCPVETIAVFSKGPWGPSSDGPDDITPDEWQAYGRGLWTFPGESRPWEAHPGTFPEQLPYRLIRYLSRVGDTVLDPFVGSGTTAAVASRLGRRAIGFDISEASVQSARRRAREAMR